MKTNVALLVFFAIASAVVSTPVFGHHGTNISYDHSKPTTLKGTVTEFVWRNPHAQLYFDVKDESGNILHWAGELNSPGVLTGQGWTRKMFVPGDEAKAGTPVGVVDRSKPIMSNGKEVVPAGRNVD